MVSMKDIAAACGVSVATVSKALNDHSDIGEETKQHIKEVAKEMGYSPNSLARALKTNRTYNIGVLFVDEAQSGLTHDYFSLVLDSFKRTVEVYFEEDDEVETYRIVTTIRENSLQGLISVESPIGKALYGKKVGDRVKVTVNESYEYYVQIRAITKTDDDSEDKIRSF